MSASFESLFGLRLADPALLSAAALVPLAWLIARTRRAPSVLLSPAALLGLGPAERPGDALPTSWRTRLLVLPTLLGVLGVLALIVALARPQTRVLEPETSEGLDLLLAFDTSSSMSSTDLGAGRTRLTSAQDAARAFVAARVEDRIGLLAFARYPDLVCPLTRDHDALLPLLAGLSTVRSDGPEDATGIGAAVARAAQALGDDPRRTRVVLLLTDGEENVATSGAHGEIAPAHAAQLCRRLGVRVHVIVAGRSASSGARSPSDTGPVEALAAATGGRFVRVESARDLDQVYGELDALERTPLSEPRARTEDRFLPFLAVGLALLLVGRWLGHGVLAVSP